MLSRENARVWAPSPSFSRLLSHVALTPPRSLVIFHDILQMESLLAGYVDIKVFLKLQLLNMYEEKSTLTRNEYPQRGLLFASRKHKLELSPTLESEVKIFRFVS